MAIGDGTYYRDSDYCAPQSVTTRKKLDAPELTLTATTDAIHVDWSAIPGATKYYVDYRRVGDSNFTTKSFASSVTTFTLDSLANGASYEFRARAVGDGAVYINSDYCAIVNATVKTQLATPTLASVERTTDSITLEWSRVSHAASYTISYAFAGNIVASTETTTSTRHTIANLESGKTYDVKVRANGDGANYLDSAYCASVSVTVRKQLDAPEITSAIATTDSITINWTESVGASKYYVQYKETGATSATVKSVSANVTSFTLSGIASGSTYEFSVRATGDGDAFVNSGYGAVQSATVKTKLATPEIATGATTDSITIDWDSVENASSYTVAYALTGGSNYTTKTTTATSFNLSELLSGGAYDVKVRANGNNILYVDSDYSDVSTVIVKTQLDAPTIVSTSATTNSVTLNWNAVEGATKYYVQYKTGSDGYQTVSVSSGATSYEVTGLPSGATYELRVRAIGDGSVYVSSDYSASESVTVKTKLAAPTLGSTDATTDSISFDWGVVPNASGYTVAYRVVGASNFTTATVSAPNWILSDLESGTTYEVKVRAKGDNLLYADSNYCATVNVTVKTKLAAPTITSVASTTDSITLNWGAVESATKYYVQYRTGSASYETIAVASGATSYTIADLLSGATYELRVRAIGDGDAYVNSDYGATTSVVVKTKLTILDLSATATTDSITATWNAVEGATKYYVQYKTGDSAYETVSVASDVTNYTLAGLSSGATYELRVRAIGDGDVYLSSDYSATISVVVKTQLAPPTLTVSATTNSITASWNAVENASGYAVAYKKSTDSEFTLVDASTTTLTLSSLISGTTYDVKVLAKGDGDLYVDSSYTSTTSVVVKTKLATPTIISTESTTDSITVNWQASENAVKYNVYYRASGSTAYETVSVPSSMTRVAIADLSSGTTYDVRVRAIGDGDTFVNSDYSATESVIVKTKLATPEITASATTDSITVNWNAIEGASKYYLQYKTGSGSYETVSVSASVTNYTIAGLTSGSEYVLRVCAIGDGNAYVNSEYSSTTTVKVKTKLATPTIEDISVYRHVIEENEEEGERYYYVAGSTVTVLWDGDENSSSYKVIYTIYGNKTEKTSGSTSFNFFVDSNLDSTTLISIKIVAIGNGLDYMDSDACERTFQILDCPDMGAALNYRVATNGGDTFTASWNEVVGASGYRIEYKQSDESNYRYVDVPAGTTTWSFPQSCEMAKYLIRVKALGDGTHYIDSPFTEATYLNMLYSPTITDTKASRGSIAIQWNNVPGANAYVLAYKESGESSFRTIFVSKYDLDHTDDEERVWSNKSYHEDDKSFSEFTINRLESGKNYDIKLMASQNQVFDQATQTLFQDRVYGASLFCDPIRIKIPEHTLIEPHISTSSTTDSITVRWNGVSNASKYLIEYKPSSSNYITYNSIVLSNNSTSYTITGLNSSTGYYIRFSAIGDGVNYADSNYVREWAKTASSSLLDLEAELFEEEFDDALAANLLALDRS